MGCCALLVAVLTVLLGVWRRLTGQRPRARFAPVARRGPPAVADIHGHRADMGSRPALASRPEVRPAAIEPASSPAFASTPGRWALTVTLALLVLALAPTLWLDAAEARATASYAMPPATNPGTGRCALPLAWQEYFHVQP